MNVFELRERLVRDYGDYVRSFINLKDDRIHAFVDHELEEGLLWPDPLIQINPSFKSGQTVDELVRVGTLHPECSRIFRLDKSESGDGGRPLKPHLHQSEAVKVARAGANYVLTTGTGSGKSLAYIIPIVDHVLRNGSGRGIQAVVVYPMNALANSQEEELKKFLCRGYPDGKGPVTFARYTGQEREERRAAILAKPPDVLLTNYVMLELILTRPEEKGLVAAARGLRFLVLDELHTYRGRQGADVAMLVRRAREAFQAERLQCVGTSATLASEGTFEEQRQNVARVGAQIFGAEVKPENVIGETLRRSTPIQDLNDPTFVRSLRDRIARPDAEPPSRYEAFVADPLSVWIESTLGIAEELGTGRLRRTTPQSITGPEGVARNLSALTGVPEERCVDAIQRHLLANYQHALSPDTGFPVFAFRLHQFISRGDTVYATVEPEDRRHLTLHGQQFVPGSRAEDPQGRLLLPLVFCRHCGHEYYCVRRETEPRTERRRFLPRELSDRLRGEDGDAGFLYVSTKDPWPEDPAEAAARLPQDWLDKEGESSSIRRDRRPALPKSVRVAPDGFVSEEGTDCHYVPAPFRFCLSCGVSYEFRQTSDFPKLASLATEGRSTATTVLSLATVRHLRGDARLEPRARKLLSFTDNRQDASLQAGHFNDFVEIGLLRSALQKAGRDAGSEGIRHEELVQRVERAFDLPLEMYASDPLVRFQALEDTKRALRAVLGYRLYRDLKRGWRVTSPNLEQCALLEIRYQSLDELCRAQDVWERCHPALSGASPEIRERIARTLLDFMRRELAIKAEYLTPDFQERLKLQSSQRLIPPWALDDNEELLHAAILYPRPRGGDDYRGHVFLSPRGGFGQYLRRHSTLPHLSGRLGTEDTQAVLEQLLGALRQAGLVEVVDPPRDKESAPGYQVPAAALTWAAGDGTRPYHDPIRMPRLPESGLRPNPFFTRYYRTIAADGRGLEAREHTAQVPSEERQEREQAFREGRLPVLYCSPTMELGVDIAELNVVNMRNIPPTPANYAQRSGRAGRSGQPALVFSYCSTYSSHDQYFFKRPERMVAGAVTPPRLDLANEDLIRAHVHAIWLSEAGTKLGSSLSEIMDTGGDQPTLALRPDVLADLRRESARSRAGERAARVLDTIRPELESAEWYSEHWLDEVFSQLERRFEQACERWRGLYAAAQRQSLQQTRIILDASRSAEDKRKADRLRREAEAQVRLLTEIQRAVEADFYSYRYFASEGFLPGYSFPRLPLSAYIPGRQGSQRRDDYVSRPRFLAISEFGPRAVVYHEGARYRINKVILPVEDRREGTELATYSVKQCERCGYLHPVSDSLNADLCQRCQAPLPPPLHALFRLQNVSTKREDRINSDEEERLRLGYEIRSGVRFGEQDGRLVCRTATATAEGQSLLNLAYGHAATLWRINLGWRRRADKERLGFTLDVESGFWARNERDESDREEDTLSPRRQRVIPFVEDRRNALLVEPTAELPEEVMASLQASLKHALRVEYQLEESELAAEPLPNSNHRRLLLFYESAEGGAGVLRHLIDDPAALGRVARQALQICHFDPDTAADLRRAPRSREDCEAACYDCLMSYSNQQDHELLDRGKIRELLLRMAGSLVQSSPGELPRAEHLATLLRQCQSNLERQWLQLLEKQGLRLPDKAQPLIEICRSRPDFLYTEAQAAIYVDGPHHEYPERQERDRAQTDSMEDHGYLVVRFGHGDDWAASLGKHPGVFGVIR